MLIIMVRYLVKKWMKFGINENMVVVWEIGEVILIIDDYLEIVCNFDVIYFLFD